MFENITKSIDELNTNSIQLSRKIILQPLIDAIQDRVNQNKTVRLNFICTHNSRRSHFSQIWAQTLSFFYQIPNITCYSGGSEVTALFSTVTKTFKSQGFFIDNIADGDNPIYIIKYADNEPAILGFSKKYDSNFNPKNDFIAILTCSNADEACPFIVGASKRIPITYKDPKAYDESDLQIEKYLEKSNEIATELKYVFSQIILN
ncbi:MAG: protein-tyrosine-phosphatase [Flavobacterium sp.]|nr:protein-tyrosine-phosphatase [Flavobacterium sp.]